MCFPLEETRLPIIPVKLKNRLNRRKNARIMAKTIQPRPRLGRGDEGATITGGGGVSGGGGGGGGAAAGGGGGNGGACSSIILGTLTQASRTGKGFGNCRNQRNSSAPLGP